MSTITISLPSLIARQIDKEFQIKGFATRSEFIRDLLRRYFVHELKFETFEPQPLEKVKFELAKTGKYNQKFIESVLKGLAKSSVYENKTAPVRSK